MSATHSAFVSHAHVDNALCQPYISLLIRRGIDVWYDQTHMQYGPLLAYEIGEQLKKRNAFILLMTDASLNSFWVRLEFGTFMGLLARDRERRRLVVPVKLVECQVPEVIEAFPCIDATRLSVDETVELIVRSLTMPGGSSAFGLAAGAPVQPAMDGPVAAVATTSSVAHPDFLPESLAEVGFVARVDRPTCDLIIPPLCEVLPGPFPMGSDHVSDPEAWPDEMPSRPVQVDGFRIGRFPVTTAEYACAVRAGIVGQPQQWHSQLERPDHPVVYVSWDDARAYADWLADQSEDPWRLATEAEWEKAARWDDLLHRLRRYPWGDRWESSLANTAEARRYGTTPIGAFPHGSSPCGALDMVGNILEWTNSIHVAYPYDGGDGREDPHSPANRVARGGSWSSGRAECRPAYRRALRPVDMFSTLGFRLACSGLGEYA